MIKLRDVLQLAWNNIEWQGPNGYVLTLAMLIGMTVPTDWDPEVASVEDWQANGTNDLDREKAEQIVQDLNTEQPWA